LPGSGKDVTQLTVKLVSVTLDTLTLRMVVVVAVADGDDATMARHITVMAAAKAIMAARPQRLPSQPILTSRRVRRGPPGGPPARARRPAALGAVEVDVV